MKKRILRKPPQETGEFIWLVSLSDLMILLFILFVVLFSVSYKKMSRAEFAAIAASLRHETAPKDPIEIVHQNLRQWVSKKKLDDKISVEKKDGAVLLQIKDQLLFASGETRLLSAGLTAIRSLSKALEAVPTAYQIGIEGHTDDIPIKTKQIKDNWDLSSERSLAVMHALRLPPRLLERTVLMAYGEMRPLVPNRDTHGRPIPLNQSKNRRVTVRIF